MFQEKHYYVYILASKKYGTLYIGVTNDLKIRLYEHQNKVNPESFTAKYNSTRLVYYEIHNNPQSAITREKILKLGNGIGRLI